MTDDQMDARLRRAGEVWRAAETPAPDIAAGEPHSLTTPAAPRPRRHRTGLFASAAVVAAALVAGGSVLVANLGGGSDKSANMESAGLEGTVWGLVGWDLVPPRQQPLDTLYISEDGDFVANDDCVLVTAHAQVTDDTITFSDATRRFLGCIDSYGPSIIGGFDPQLSMAHYTIDSAGLTLRGVGDHALHFVAAPDLPIPTADYPTFTDTNWQLVQVDGGSGPTEVSDHLALRVDGDQLRADTGCNTIAGAITQDGDQVVLDASAVTPTICRGDKSLVQAVIDGRFTQQVRGAELTISKEGVGTLVYEWVPADVGATDPGKLTDRAWHLTSVAGTQVNDRVVVNVHADGSVTGYDGCRDIGSARADVGAGTLKITGLPTGDVSSANCDGDLASNVESMLGQGALWHLSDGDLVINSPGNAQGFALVFELEDPTVTPNEPSPLFDTAWYLTAIKDADGNDVQVGGDATLQVDVDGKVTGRDGCNYFSGNAQVGDDTIDFASGLAVTEMYCPDPVIRATSEQIHAVLTGQVRWSIDGDRLTLGHDGAGKLIYSAHDPNPPVLAPLKDTTWSLTAIQDGSGPDGTASTVVTEVTVLFGGDGHVMISHRCYIDKADFVVGNDSLDITNKSAPTAVPCPATLTQDQEQQENQIVDDVLSGSSTWRIDGGGLHVTKDDMTLDFTAQVSTPRLVGTPWRLTQLATENANSGSGTGSADTNVVLTIDKAGGYLVETGCVPYAGSAEVSDDTVIFTDQHTPPGNYDQCANTFADQLSALLDGPVSWSISDDQLTLTNGHATATFVG